MVAGAITGNISAEATTEMGYIFADATRGCLRAYSHVSHGHSLYYPFAHRRS